MNRGHTTDTEFGFEKFSPYGLNTSQFQRLLTDLESPHLKLPTILIGGTNGKGTVAAYTANLLYQQGKRVGLFISPHVQSYRERFSINGKQIDAVDFTNIAMSISSRCNVYTLNYFQFLTMVAWFYFIDKSVDLAILEVGIGGRLDPTNASNPIASAIASIDLDHMDRLGSDVEAIFMEKMAIARPGKPMVFAALQTHLQEMALSWGAQTATPVILPEPSTRRLPAYQRHNLAAALHLAQALLHNTVSKTTIAHVLKNTCLPARRQQVGEFLIDMAHNDAAIGTVLASASLKQRFTNIIIAQPRHHPWQTAWRDLIKTGARIICPNLDGLDSESKNYFSPANVVCQRFCDLHAEVAIPASLSEAISSCKDSPTLVIGSSRLAGAVLRLLSIDTNQTPLYS